MQRVCASASGAYSPSAAWTGGTLLTRLGYIKLSSPWVLSAVPALAYALAYVDRLGEAFARGIPSDWITVSLTDALSRTALIVLAVALMRGSQSMLSRWRQKSPRWAHDALANMADQSGIIVLFAVVVGDLWIAGGILLISLLWSLVTSIVHYRKRGKLPPNAEPRVEDSVSEPPGDLAERQVRSIVLVALLALALISAVWGGWGRATMRRDVMVTLDGRRILAASYSGYVVLADLSIHDGRWYVGDERTYLAVGGGTPVTFLRKKAPSYIRW